MAELPGKAERVIGVFIFMIGAGFIVDRHALWAGVAVMIVGVAAFARGALLARAPLTAAASADVIQQRTESQP